ncbi:sigma-54-dependent Fis family transcriptional regulator [Klebsiella michiganensis]|uniref:sigma-54-dependent Fis family transcriptional regulator n=1 Tax=Klebsiella michiganensis TaxID=1134687 RepID=UPI0025A13973|nr:sigma 54-interacting transcriptional regulator [Klebsiella michiganensis]MDM6772585.1 sigma 54-interacting transcriptional regulator [Klebsiella michiganensis]HDT0414678.1 sigma 54-interacting transcriptional regulator [Klebsiella michiganensis]
MIEDSSSKDGNYDPNYWRSQEMLLLQQVISLSGKSFTYDKVFKETLHLLSELLGLNRGRIVMHVPGSKEGRIRHSYGLTREEAEKGVYQFGEGITGLVLAHGQLAVVQDIDSEPMFLFRAVSRKRLPQEPVAFIALPIIVGQRVKGVLACHRIRLRSRPLSDDLTILRILATFIGQLLHLEAHIDEKNKELEHYNQLLAQASHHDVSHYGIVGNSPELIRAISELERVSDSTASVLLLGESGTGKELFARALHLASPRQGKPFIKVNCAAIPDTLFESELFGYEKGAFTGANSLRQGLFEQANEGTIFLDEIGELPLNLQGKLLRTLQEGTITRLGGTREIFVDVRVVVATNRDLSNEVQHGHFREDLYYRLNVIPIHLPSLPERKSDIPALIFHFLNRFNQANQRNVNLKSDAISLLQNHDWPGNIRELSNIIERMVLLSDKPVLNANDVENFIKVKEIRTPLKKSIKNQEASSNLPVLGEAIIRPYSSYESHSKEELLEAIKRAGGNKSRAAQNIGLTARQLVYRLKKLS